MGCPIYVRSPIVLLAAVTGLFCADDTQWGPVESGLQLGIGVSATSEPALRISLRNAGAEPRDLPIGYEGSTELYNVEFTARKPAQQVQSVFDLNALQSAPSSVVLPISTHLQPGEIREFTYPISRLICFVHRTDAPFRTLLEQGYTVRADFELPGVRLASPEFSWRQ